MDMEYNEEDLDVVKLKVTEALEDFEGPLAVLALVEVAVEMAVKETGGAVEGLSMFLSAAAAAPIVAEEAEGKGAEWVH